MDERIDKTRQRFDQALQGEGPSTDLEVICRELDMLEGVASRRRRHRSLLLAGRVAAAMVAGAALLALFHVGRTDVALLARTSAFVVGNGQAEQTLLEGIEARDIMIGGRLRSPVAWCDEATPSADCRTARRLTLDALRLNAAAHARISRDASWIEVEMTAGRGSILLSFGDDSFVDKALDVGDIVRIRSAAGAQEVIIRGPAPDRLTVGGLTSGSASERRAYPALSEGTLTMTETGRSVQLLKTDVAHVVSSSGQLVVRLQDPIDLALVAQAVGVDIKRGTGVVDLMPTWLDWLRSWPPLNATLTLVGAIVGATWALRERWLSR